MKYNEKNKEIIVLEINTIPGDLSFYIWEKNGLPFKELIDKLITLARERYNDKQKNSIVFPTNILQTLDILSGSKAGKRG